MIRALLVAGCVLLFVLAAAAMRTGWVHRGRRQDTLAALPEPPAEPGQILLGPDRGLYVGTTAAGRWQDRIVARGLGVRADAELILTDQGVLVDRAGASTLFLPTAVIVGAGVGAGLAGKVLGPGGLLLVRWRLGDVELDTGFRADDKGTYPTWVAALDELTAHGPGRADTLAADILPADMRAEGERA